MEPESEIPVSGTTPPLSKWAGTMERLEQEGKIFPADDDDDLAIWDETVGDGIQDGIKFSFYRQSQKTKICHLQIMNCLIIQQFSV